MGLAKDGRLGDRLPLDYIWLRMSPTQPFTTLGLINPTKPAEKCSMMHSSIGAPSGVAMAVLAQAVENGYCLP